MYESKMCILPLAGDDPTPRSFCQTPQSTPVGTTIYRSIQATDKDAGVNGLVEYFIVEGSQNISDISPNTLTAADGFGVFAIAYPHQGQVTVVKTLDYERTQRYYLTIVASRLLLLPQTP
uniref:Uncharacterized protein n=1 Tax=Anopheles atroparvus TaxID=41427 RepID=A0A182IMF2_ANOAO